MKIQGAVLEQIGADQPFSASTPLVVDELDLDGPRSGEVLVRIEAAGVCHSDLSVVTGQRPRPTPMLLGHEAAGRVVEVGSGVDDLTEGERVTLVFTPWCGTCSGCRSAGRRPCERGAVSNTAGTLLGGGTRLSRRGEPVLHHLGVSAFATHAVVDRSSVVAVGDDVPAVTAALLGCAVLTGGGAVLNAGRLETADRVAIVGLGGVGMAALLVAAGHGAAEVVAVDQLESKRERALRLGANAAMSPEEAIGAGIKADLVIEAAGVIAAFETAIAMTGVGGRTVTVGLPHPDGRASISPLGLVAEARTVIGSYLGSSVPTTDIPNYVAQWRDGRLPVELLATDLIRLDQINSAMDALFQGEAVRQIVVVD